MKKKPNILFFLADQLRYDCVGYAGKYPVATPNADKIGAQGAVFTKCFTPTPVCAPARQSFLSGRRAESLGALWNYNFIGTKTLQPEDDCFTKRLAGAGYENILVGAWDGSTRPPEEFALNNLVKPFDYNAFVKEKYPQVKYENGWFGERNPIPAEDSRPFWYADRAIEQIERLSKTDKPWMVWVDGVDPHLPCRPSSPYYEMYDPEKIPRWDGFGDDFTDKPYIQKQQLYNWRLEGRSWEQWAPTVACYYAMITQVDAAFGKIVDAIDKMGLAEDTLIVFTSDHGDMCGSHGMMDKHYILYDDVIRVPLAMRLPGVIPAGTKVGDYVYNCLDWAATLGELAGFEMPACSGKSLLPLTKGEPQQRDEFAVCASNGQQFGFFTQRSIRTDRYKYIWNLTDIDELYDLQADPGELKNLVKDNRFDGLVAELRKKMKAELLRCGDPFAKVGWLSRQLDENVKLK